MFLGGDGHCTALPLWAWQTSKLPLSWGPSAGALGLPYWTQTVTAWRWARTTSFCCKSRPRPQLLAFWCLPCMVIAAGAPQ